MYINVYVQKRVFRFDIERKNVDVVKNNITGLNDFTSTRNHRSCRLSFIICN